MPHYKAVVDIGTNSFHLIIAEVESGRIVRTVHDEKKIMRLGTETESPLKYITTGEIVKSIDYLRKFARLAEFYNAEIFSVATSAVRESDNGEEFTEAVKKETGIEVEVIDGSKEASYIYRGVQNALPVNSKKVLCIDIGGGSTEVIIGQDSTTNFVQSYKLGAVRLSKLFFPGYTLSTEAVKKCSEFIRESLRNSELHEFIKGYDIAVGASGTVQAISALVASAKYGNVPKDLNGFSFTAEELNKAAELILKYQTVEERMEVEAIETSRADILPAGTLILTELFSILSISRLTISSYALREGYLLSRISL